MTVTVTLEVKGEIKFFETCGLHPRELDTVTAAMRIQARSISAPWQIFFTIKSSI